MGELAGVFYILTTFGRIKEHGSALKQMHTGLKFICTLLCLVVAACSDNNSGQLLISETVTEKKVHSHWFRLSKISWNDSKKVNLRIDSSLSHSTSIDCDSVLAIDYRGFEGEHYFYPINEKGQWINTIYKVRKLDKVQAERFDAILGSRSSYLNPRIVACYEPRLALVYFKNNAVIAQTQVCLSCAGLLSTAKTGDPVQKGMINQKAVDDFQGLIDELEFFGHK